VDPDTASDVFSGGPHAKSSILVSTTWRLKYILPSTGIGNTLLRRFAATAVAALSALTATLKNAKQLKSVRLKKTQ
jgi:hypothetical protein